MGADPTLDEAIQEVAALLASAFRRRARIRQVTSSKPPLESTEALDSTVEPSPHELTLTRRRKESRRA